MAEMKQNQIHVARDQKNTINVVTVPVIFLPGVMGSRLTFTKGNDEVKWDPDDDITMLRKWIWPDTDVTHARFLNWKAEVDELGVRTVEEWEKEAERIAEVNRIAAMYGQPGTPVPPKPELTDAQRARGWGGVVWSFYGPILKQLSAIHLPGFRCPVYAIGYPWCNSNIPSAEYVAKKINGYLDQQKAKKCILVTHSMGGLVARAVCKLVEGLESKVIGIVHTVQPAHGAPVAYRRFHTGANHPQSDGGSLGGDFKANLFTRILGREWWEYTAIMSASPGPLQLLPNNLYHMETHDSPLLRSGKRISPRQGSPGTFLQTTTTKLPPSRWLRVSQSAGPFLTAGGTDTSHLPEEAFQDAGANIYDVYRDHPTLKLLRSYDDDIDDFDSATWSNILVKLRSNITRAEVFHSHVGPYQHPTTWVLAGNEHTQTEAGCVVSARNGWTDELTWRTDPSDYAADDMVYVDKGAMPRDWARHAYVRTITERGDKTVPLTSAIALKPTEKGKVVDNPDSTNPPRRLITTGEHAAIFGKPSSKSDVRDFVEKAVKSMLQQSK